MVHVSAYFVKASELELQKHRMTTDQLAMKVVAVSSLDISENKGFLKLDSIIGKALELEDEKEKHDALLEVCRLMMMDAYTNEVAMAQSHLQKVQDQFKKTNGFSEKPDKHLQLAVEHCDETIIEKESVMSDICSMLETLGSD